MPTQSKVQKKGGKATAHIPETAKPHKALAACTNSKRRSLTVILRACKKKFPNGNPHGEIW